MVEKQKPTKQYSRYTDEELSLIKNTFAERDDLLKTIRKKFLGLELSEQDDINFTKILTDNVKEVLSKTLYPAIDGDAPLHQLASLWMFTVADIKDMTKDKAIIYIKAREVTTNFIEQKLVMMLNNSDYSNLEILFSDLKERANKTDDEYYIGILAYVDIISFIDSQLAQLGLLAGEKDETEEEQAKRIAKNSSK